NGVDAGYKYTFKINAYGNYTVSYEAKDGSERSNRKVQSYIIRSKDKVKPQITLTNIVESAKKGANVKIANVEVLNKTGCTIFATVETPEGIITKIAPGDSFKAEISGVYKVNYIVIDSIDNRTYAGYRIIVS
ncbi:MAG: hypothetical protein PHO93_04845, partial [Candidatus Saccharimonadaceae bacterium]|nr:hypothetical protein [Candidatus Saccharimonadaceae bacterium]